jgi:hypothetical protein
MMQTSEIVRIFNVSQTWLSRRCKAGIDLGRTPAGRKTLYDPDKVAVAVAKEGAHKKRRIRARYPDCETYEDCLSKAARVNGAVSCYGCRRYLKVEFFEKMRA